MKTISEIKSAFDDRLSVAAREWFNNSIREVQNKFIVMAQRDGIDAAIAEIQLMVDD